MSCKTETKTIGDNEYSVTQWPAEKSLLIKFKLIKALGASLTALAGAFDKNASDDMSIVSESLSSLFNNSSPEELVSLMKTCIEGTARNGKRLTGTSFNEVFSTDDLLEIYKVFIFVMQVNYGNFIKGQSVEDLLAKAKVKL